jgi:hypothetical protein
MLQNQEKLSEFVVIEVFGPVSAHRVSAKKIPTE